MSNNKTMNTKLIKIIRMLPLVIMLNLSTFGGITYIEADKEMKEQIKGMADAEKKFKEDLSKRAVAFMSLETMFPDEKVRALAKAAGKGKIQTIEKLAREGVDVNSRGAQGATPLFWAMRNYKGFAKLLSLGADPNIIYDDGNSVMFGAIILANDRRVLKAALEHGGNPNLTSGEGVNKSTPMGYALSQEVGAVKLLLSYGADINERDFFDSTPVLSVAETGYFEMVYFLLEAGADYRLKDKLGRDVATKVAASIGKIRPGTKWAMWQTKVIEWLKAHDVDISQK